MFLETVTGAGIRSTVALDAGVSAALARGKRMRGGVVLGNGTQLRAVRAAASRCRNSASRPRTGTPELRLRQPSPVPSLPASCGHHHQMHGPCHGTLKHLLQNEAVAIRAGFQAVSRGRHLSATGDTTARQEWGGQLREALFLRAAGLARKAAS